LNGNGSVVSINNKLKQMGVNSQTEIQDSIDGSQLVEKISKIAPDSDEDPGQPRIELKNN